MTTLQISLALAGFFVVFVLHTGALFYWGGQVKKSITVMQAEIIRLRDWKHDEAQQDLTQLKIRVGILEEQIKEAKGP